MALPMDSLVNQAAKFWYISNEQGTVPLVVRSAVGARRPLRRDPLADPRHLVPGRPGAEDRVPVLAGRGARACSRASIRDDNPVIFLEHKRLYSVKGPPPGGERVSSRSARRTSRARATTSRSSRSARASPTRWRPPTRWPRRRHRRGGDRPPHPAPARPRHRARVGRATNRLLAVEEGPRTGGWATGLLGAVAEQGLHDLDDAWIARDRRDAGALQPDARGRVPARRGRNRGIGALAPRRGGLSFHPAGCGPRVPAVHTPRARTAGRSSRPLVGLDESLSKVAADPRPTLIPRADGHRLGPREPRARGAPICSGRGREPSAMLSRPAGAELSRRARPPT